MSPVDKTSVKPSLAIIIINWNSFDFTSDCLISLRSSTYENATVIVVDNDSQDDSPQRLMVEFPEIHLILNEDNGGFTGGNNVGIEYALTNSFELVMLLNNDTFVVPDFAEHLVAKITSDESIGAVQPKIFFNHDRTLVWNAGGVYSKWLTWSKTIGEGKKDSESFNQTKEVDWITGCAFLVKAEVIRKVGSLSDLFFYGCFDDVDWSLRIKREGYKLYYCPNSVIYHAVASSSINSSENKEGTLKPFFHYLVNRNHLILLRRHTPWIFIVPSYLFQAIKFCSYSLYFISRGRFRKLKAFIHGFYHGLVKPLDPEVLAHKYYIKKYK